MAITSKGEKVVALSGGGPIGPDRMELLEQKVNTLSEDVAVIKSNYATKGDLQEMSASLGRWMLGVFVSIVTIMTGILGAVIWHVVGLLASHH